MFKLCSRFNLILDGKGTVDGLNVIYAQWKRHYGTNEIYPRSL